MSGCRNGSQKNEVQIRLINAVPVQDGLNVSLDGRQIAKHLAFRSSTDYQGMAAGTFRVQANADTSGASLPRSLTLEKGHRYTALALSPQSGNPAAQVQLLEDEGTEAFPAGKAGIRLFQAAPDAGPVDLVVNSIVAVKSVGFGQRSGFLLLDHGGYDFKVAAADTPDTLTAPIRLRLDAGHSYTLVVMGQSVKSSLSLEAYPDNP